MTGGNRGQIVKEYLAHRGVPAAQIKQRNLVCRAKLKLPGGKIGFPTHLTISPESITKRLILPAQFNCTVRRAHYTRTYIHTLAFMDTDMDQVYRELLCTEA